MERHVFDVMFLQICLVVGLYRRAVHALGVSAVSAEVRVGFALNQTRLAVEQDIHFVFRDIAFLANDTLFEAVGHVVGTTLGPIVHLIIELTVLVELNEHHIAVL